jgi:site-specific recombinase XerD
MPNDGDHQESVPIKPAEPVPGVTLRELYDAYMSDPTRDWSPRTRLSYETTRKLVLAIVGEKTPVRSITRAHCRTLIETLRWLPRKALTLYPRLNPVEIAARAKKAERTDLMSPSNINTYLNKVGGVFNWAVKEEMMDRNPAKGLKMPDATLRRDKRLPFSITQLRGIFAALKVTEESGVRSVFKRLIAFVAGDLDQDA